MGLVAQNPILLFLRDEKHLVEKKDVPKCLGSIDTERSFSTQFPIGCQVLTLFTIKQKNQDVNIRRITISLKRLRITENSNNTNSKIKI